MIKKLTPKHEEVAYGAYIDCFPDIVERAKSIVNETERLEVINAMNHLYQVCENHYTARHIDACDEKRIAGQTLNLLLDKYAPKG